MMNEWNHKITVETNSIFWVGRICYKHNEKKKIFRKQIEYDESQFIIFIVIKRWDSRNKIDWNLMEHFVSLGQQFYFQIYSSHCLVPQCNLT